eukprot:TRINITY_DN8220_c1_g1_i1.p4 TRINITY_DN8220_c1_g1~~TRINITY_DN8220_c1_g1_i1.p4  ORF type:complete len:143 (+),score=3.67 TRINITY_DN8220_c1_g1_i1:449-877(+)
MRWTSSDRGWVLDLHWRPCAVVQPVSRPSGRRPRRADPVGSLELYGGFRLEGAPGRAEVQEFRGEAVLRSTAAETAVLLLVRAPGGRLVRSARFTATSPRLRALSCEACAEPGDAPFRLPQAGWTRVQASDLARGRRAFSCG